MFERIGIGKSPLVMSDLWVNLPFILKPNSSSAFLCPFLVFISSTRDSISNVSVNPISSQSSLNPLLSVNF